jgi:hypothetical protein
VNGQEGVDVKDDVFTLSADYTYDWATLHGAWTSFDRKPGDANSAAVPPAWAGATQTDISQRPRSDSQYLFALPGTPIGGLNEATGIFPSNAPPIPGFPVTTFDSLPLVSKKFVMAKLRLAYHASKNLTANAMYWKQKYDNTDWQTDLMQPYMGRVDPVSNRWFFLGARVPSYDANIFRASLTYTF